MRRLRLLVSHRTPLRQVEFSLGFERHTNHSMTLCPLTSDEALVLKPNRGVVDLLL